MKLEFLLMNLSRSDLIDDDTSIDIAIDQINRDGDVYTIIGSLRSVNVWMYSEWDVEQFNLDFKSNILTILLGVNHQ